MFIQNIKKKPIPKALLCKFIRSLLRIACKLNNAGDLKLTLSRCTILHSSRVKLLTRKRHVTEEARTCLLARRLFRVCNDTQECNESDERESYTILTL